MDFVHPSWHRSHNFKVLSSSSNHDSNHTCTLHIALLWVLSPSFSMSIFTCRWIHNTRRNRWISPLFCSATAPADRQRYYIPFSNLFWNFGTFWKLLAIYESKYLKTPRPAESIIFQIVKVEIWPKVRIFHFSVKYLAFNQLLRVSLSIGDFISCKWNLL